MDAERYLVEAHLRDGRSISELARVHGVHRSWLHKRWRGIALQRKRTA